MHNVGAMAKIKTATSFLNKQSGTQFHHDWKSMQSIIDILHKNFQDHTNSRFPGGFLNPRRFPGVVDNAGCVVPCYTAELSDCPCVQDDPERTELLTEIWCRAILKDEYGIAVLSSLVISVLECHAVRVVCIGMVYDTTSMSLFQC